MRFKEKTVLITGGSRGIGREVALKFASEGANIIVNYTSRNDAALQVVEEAKALGVEAICIQCDVSSLEDVENMGKEILKTFDKVDVLVNNAGVTRDGLLIRMKESDWDSVLDINLKGVFNTSKVIGKHMMKKKAGAIVNITSVVGITGNAGQANYAASKAGVIGFTKSMAKEFAPRKIRINCVAPGFIKTDMTDKLSEDVIEHYQKNIPLGDLGSPEDVAKAVLFLTSDDAKYITGQTLNVCGGMVM